jgi:hypothetical protein
LQHHNLEKQLKNDVMKFICLFLLLVVSFSVKAQAIDTTKASMTSIVKNDSLIRVQETRTYKVDMMSQSQQRDTVKAKAPNFLEPYKEKRLESNYNYDDGKVTGGSTQLKLGKKKKN